ncbi:MAG: hypothetical protein ACOYXT_22295, partial [Bacteroidota bacterium]
MLIIVAIIIQALAFYCLYNTSQRAELWKDELSVWLQRHTLFSKIAGVLLVILSFVLLVIAQGFATGIFTAFLSIMTLGSLIILLVPLTAK